MKPRGHPILSRIDRVGRDRGHAPPPRHVVQGAHEVGLVDADTDGWRRLLPRSSSGRLWDQLSLSREGTLLIENTSPDGDVWLFETTDEGR